jgi:hypothetical protein
MKIAPRLSICSNDLFFLNLSFSFWGWTCVKNRQETFRSCWRVCWNWVCQARMLLVLRREHDWLQLIRKPVPEYRVQHGSALYDQRHHAHDLQARLKQQQLWNDQGKPRLNMRLAGKSHSLSFNLNKAAHGPVPAFTSEQKRFNWAHLRII